MALASVMFTSGTRAGAGELETTRTRERIKANPLVGDEVLKYFISKRVGWFESTVIRIV